jgi:hypothetical protein
LVLQKKFKNEIYSVKREESETPSCWLWLEQNPIPSLDQNLVMAYPFVRFLDHTQRHEPQSVLLFWKSDRLIANIPPDNTQH